MNGITLLVCLSIKRYLQNELTYSLLALFACPVAASFLFLADGF